MTHHVFIETTRKSGLTPAQFKEHYENNHIPLILKLAGDTLPISLTRRYVLRTAAPAASITDTSNATHQATVFAGQQEAIAHDAVAEVVFRDLAHFEKFFEVFRRPEVAEELAKDEERFLDREKIKIFAMEPPCVTAV